MLAQMMVSTHLDKFVQVECVPCPWLPAQMKVATMLGVSSRVTPVDKTQEGGVVGF